MSTTPNTPSSAVARNDNSNPQQGAGAPREALLARPKIPPTQKDSRKLFVGGLPSDITTDEFHTFFEQFGPVMDSVVMFDRNTGRSRGFGFVTFHEHGDADRLIGMGPDSSDQTGRLEMRGKMIEVKRAEPKESKGRFPSRNYRHQQQVPPVYNVEGAPYPQYYAPPAEYMAYPVPFAPFAFPQAAGAFYTTGFPVGNPMTVPAVPPYGFAPPDMAPSAPMPGEVPP